MLDIKILRQNPEIVRNSLSNRGTEVDLDGLLELDAKRRAMIQEGDDLKAKRNQFSEQMSKNRGGTPEQKQEIRQIGERIKVIDTEMKDLELAIDDIIKRIPNIPHETVAVGSSEEDNPVIRTVGSKPEFSFAPKEHWDIGESLGILDFKRAAKITGARFCLNWGAGAKMERALINFMLDIHTKEHGCTEVWTPFMANRDSFTATGQLPKFEEDLFRTDDYFLVPTAEVPVTNIYRDETLPEDKLPIKLVAYTPCFRREAGSYGKDTRGLIRQHQFDKVELVRFAHPDHSFIDLEELTNEAEDILKKLGLHYRVISLCTGDLGFSSAKTYDLEVWMPGQGVFKEISSCSCFTDFQARRGGMRYKSAQMKKSEFCHTLNGSGLAVGRTLAAILENYQNEDGTVRIPEALKPYMGLDLIEPIR